MAETEPAQRKSSSNPDKNSQKTGVAASNKTMNAQDSETDGATLSATAAPADTEILPLPTRPPSPKKSSRATKSAHDQAEEMGPPPTPELTRDGQHSLTRALGLKIGRIVIDAGHGGHDTGTIGPTGLMEKDLCLDVSLRLGKIIQQRLPSADVVFTRNDDTFIPLERRTEIANEAKADLFISVHANSSQDHKARGIETYYLNFTGSSDAMEVASRENALSANGVHDLQDIVAKIARSEKIEESRDLATMVQDSLSKHMENLNRGDRNRGVRKAPFVVLIGADMPSVLAEISFLSNPSDEKWLKNPENRQRVADGLYRGIETYLQSTNSLTSNQSRSAAENFAGKVARSGNSQ
jgi:N-acetylmuramoyl-L-alanine amidase